MWFFLKIRNIVCDKTAPRVPERNTYIITTIITKYRLLTDIRDHTVLVFGFHAVLDDFVEFLFGQLLACKNRTTTARRPGQNGAVRARMRFTRRVL